MAWVVFHPVTILDTLSELLIIENLRTAAGWSLVDKPGWVGVDKRAKVSLIGYGIVWEIMLLGCNFY